VARGTRQGLATLASLQERLRAIHLCLGPTLPHLRPVVSAASTVPTHPHRPADPRPRDTRRGECPNAIMATIIRQRAAAGPDHLGRRRASAARGLAGRMRRAVGRRDRVEGWKP
jgi:hypothetical protein